MMIEPVKNKESQAVFERKTVKKWLSFRDHIERRLQILDMPITLDDLKILINKEGKNIRDQIHPMQKIA